MTENQKRAIMLMQIVRPGMGVTVSYNSMNDILEFRYNSLDEGEGVIIISPADENEALAHIVECTKIIVKISRSMRKRHE